MLLILGVQLEMPFVAVRSKFRISSHEKQQVWGLFQSNYKEEKSKQMKHLEERQRKTSPPPHLEVLMTGKDHCSWTVIFPSDRLSARATAVIFCSLLTKLLWLAKDDWCSGQSSENQHIGQKSGHSSGVLPASPHSVHPCLDAQRERGLRKSQSKGAWT